MAEHAIAFVILPPFQFSILAIRIASVVIDSVILALHLVQLFPCCLKLGTLCQVGVLLEELLEVVLFTLRQGFFNFLLFLFLVVVLAHD